MTKISQLPPAPVDDTDEVPTRRGNTNKRVSIPSIVSKCVAAVSNLIAGKADSEHNHDSQYEPKNSSIVAHIENDEVHVTTEEKNTYAAKLDRTPLVDKGSQATAVSFSLDKDSRQKVVATGTALAVNFVSLPVTHSTTSVIDIAASGTSVAVTFDASIPATSWINGDVLASIAAGVTYSLSVTTCGDSKSALLIAYAKKGA